MLGAIIGLIGSAIPSVIKFFQDKSDKKHEIKLLELQLQYREKEHQYTIEEAQISADVAESEHLYEYAKPQVTGFKFLDGVSNFLVSSVRPVITYAFMGFYIMLKINAFMYDQNVSLSDLWTDWDFELLSAIVMFWFGQRSFARLHKNI